MPYVPAEDTVILERLPALVPDVARELKDLHGQWVQRPHDQALAEPVAERYIELGQTQGDPRYFGRAQAVLEPWWRDPDPSESILLLRAALHQNRHEFALALEDLSKLLKRNPDAARAWLMRAVILIVQADYREAARACDELTRLREAFLAFSCLGSVAALSGHARGGYQLLQLAMAQAAHGSLPEQVRLQTLLGKVAERLDQPHQAEAHYQAALALDASNAYTLAAYADFLLDRHRARDVLSLLRDFQANDSLLLRLTLAEQAEQEPGFADHRAALGERFAASRARGDSLHRGDEARFLLHIEKNAEDALRLAESNWQVQREPRDARVLVEAALAAARPQAARPVVDYLRSTGLEDPALRRLVARLPDGQRP